ncbi:MAG: DUF1761 domain-containing protein [bacterium]
MNFVLNFSDINWLSVLVSALAAFAVGGLWYSPVLFSKVWQREVKLSDEDIKDSNMTMIFGTTFVLNIIGAIALDLVIGVESTLGSGFCTGLFVSVVWIATSFGINYLYTRKSLKLFLIDAFYYIVFFSLMGAILGAW